MPTCSPSSNVKAELLAVSDEFDRIGFIWNAEDDQWEHTIDPGWKLVLYFDGPDDPGDPSEWTLQLDWPDTERTLHRSHYRQRAEALEKARHLITRCEGQTPNSIIV